MPFIRASRQQSPIVSAELRNPFKGLKSIIAAGNIPIGCMLAYLKNLVGAPAPPNTWVECDGQLLNDPGSPFDGVNIPA